jgi:two-component system, sensor histidine kinase YesM
VFNPSVIFSKINKLNRLKIPLMIKLFCTFLILVIPVLFLSLQIIEMAKEEVKSQIARSKMEQVDFYITSLDNEIQRIMSLQKEYMNDIDLQKLSSFGPNLSIYEKTEIINRLYQKLDVLKHSSAYIEEVKVMIPSIQRSISPTDYIDYYEYQKNDEWGSDLVAIKNEEITINLVYPTYYDNTPSFIMEIKLSNDYLKQTLNQFADTGGAVFIHPELEISTADDQIANKMMNTFMENDLMMGGPITLSSLNISDTDYMVIHGKPNILNIPLLVYIPEENLIGTMNEYGVFIKLLIGITVLMTLLFSYIIYFFIHKPIRILVNSFERVERGEFNFKINSLFNDEFNYIYNSFNTMTEKLEKLIHEIYLQKLHLYQAELKQLQAQINPHFLYNSFFILHRMIKYKHAEAAAFSINLGHYFKYITRNSDEKVSLQEEYKHTIAYLEIQKIRFSNRLSVVIDPLPEQCKDIKIPRLIMQPIVENAFEHGIQNKITDALLSISFITKGDILSICIEDNGDITQQLIDDLLASLHKEQFQITGLTNVHKRLQLNFGKTGALTFEMGKDNGLKVLIKIPIKGEDVNV